QLFFVDGGDWLPGSAIVVLVKLQTVAFLIPPVTASAVVKMLKSYLPLQVFGASNPRQMFRKGNAPGDRRVRQGFLFLAPLVSHAVVVMEALNRRGYPRPPDSRDYEFFNVAVHRKSVVLEIYLEPHRFLMAFNEVHDALNLINRIYFVL